LPRLILGSFIGILARLAGPEAGQSGNGQSAREPADAIALSPSQQTVHLGGPIPWLFGCASVDHVQPHINITNCSIGND
jgi:hypothetical protein